MKPTKNLEERWWFRDTKNILFAFGAVFFLCAAFTVIINATELEKFELYAKDGSSQFKWWDAYVFAPIMEEFGCRWIPIMALLAVVNRDKQKFDKVKWFYAAFISFWFGYMHGGYFNIYIQGVLGFGLCYLYFRNKYGYFSAVLLHFLWNFTLGSILPSTGF